MGNKYLNPNLSGNYVQATVDAIEESYDQASDLIDYIESINITSQNISTIESISNGDFSSTADWVVAHGLIFGGTLQMTSIGPPSTATQAIVDMSNVLGGTTYKFEYDIINPLSSGVLKINAGFSAVDVILDAGSTGSKFLYFFSAEVPTDFVISYTPTGDTAILDNLSLKAVSYDIKNDDLNSVGLIIGYPRPVMPSPYYSEDGYLDTQTYITLLKLIAIMKFNGTNWETLDNIVSYVLTDLGGSQNYVYKYSSNGVSSPCTDIIINLIDNVNDIYIYILETVFAVFFTQGIKINIVHNPFCFAFWNGGWTTNPEGSGLSRLNGAGTEADKDYGGQMYGVI